MGELKIGKITLGACQTNCYFVYKTGSNKVVFFDPADSGKYICDKLKENNFEVAAIFFTHGHFDHIMGAKEMKAYSNAKIYAPEADKVLLNDPYVNVSAQWAKAFTIEADEYFKDGAVYDIEGVKFKVIATPGHTIGSCSFYFEEDNMLIAGDTLFYESIGRTDLPTGSMSKLAQSLKEKILVLPDKVKVYPGHGSSTDIEHERLYNPFA